MPSFVENGGIFYVPAKDTTLYANARAIRTLLKFWHLGKILSPNEIPEFVIRGLDKQQELRNAEAADREAWLEQYIKPMPKDGISFKDLFYSCVSSAQKIRRIMQ
jgi:hypothetical protein